MRKFFKLLYQLKLRRRFEEIDAIAYLKRLARGKHPADDGYFSAKDAMQFTPGPTIKRTSFRGASVFFRCEMTYPLEWKILQSGYFDRDVLELVADLIRPGLAIADVGGNVGGLAIPWALALPEVEVHSFEPNPLALARFRHNLDLNPAARLHVVEKAVGERPGSLEFHAFDGQYLADSSFVQPPKIDNPGRVMAVEVITLDDYFADRPVQPGVIKLDIQGYEAQALAGAARLLAQARPYIVFEHEDHNFPQASQAERAKQALAEIFAAHRYDVYYITRYSRDLLLPVDWQRPLAGNLLALPR